VSREWHEVLAFYTAVLAGHPELVPAAVVRAMPLDSLVAALPTECELAFILLIII
jgi:hypothetical protein